MSTPAICFFLLLAVVALGVLGYRDGKHFDAMTDDERADEFDRRQW